MIKCQRCSAVHEHPDDCNRPSEVLKHVSYKDLSFFVAEDSSYLQLRLTGFRFVEETDCLEPATLKGRKWRLSPHMTRSEIVQTAFMAALAWEEHECREAFKYRGQAVFGPHYNIEALVKLCEQGQLDVRQNSDIRIYTGEDQWPPRT